MQTLDAILMEKSLDDTFSREDITRIFTEMSVAGICSYDPVLPVYLESQSSAVFGFILDYAAEKHLVFDLTQNSRYGKAVIRVLDDMNLESEDGCYDFWGVKTKIFRNSNLEGPLPMEEIRRQSEAEDGFISGTVEVPLSDIIDGDIETFLDMLSEKLTGSLLLTDISYEVIGPGKEQDNLVLKVTGNASELIAEEESTADSSNGEWVVTDDDCCQLRRAVNGEETQFELVQVNRYTDTLFKVAHTIIDLETYNAEDIGDVRQEYGYDAEEDIDPGTLAEMLFENCAMEVSSQDTAYTSWKAAVLAIEQLTGEDLSRYYEKEE